MSAAKLGIAGLTAADFDYLTRGWHALDPWPDSVPGLSRLKRRFVIGPLVQRQCRAAGQHGQARRAAVGRGAERRGVRSLQTGPGAYLGAAGMLGLAPGEVMLVAAHNSDLAAAQALGLKTAFVPRVTEYGPLQSRGFGPEGDWDFVVTDLNDLADRLGC